MEFKSYKSPDRNLKQRRSINFFLLLFSGIFVVILLKLVNIQIIDSEKYKIAARKQYENKITLMPYRGLIYDRNMNVLVSNTFDYSFAADPNMTDEPEKVAQIFATIFGKSRQEYLSKLTSQNTSFVYLERGVKAEDTKGLDTMVINGIIVLKEPKRVYNYGSLASQVLGFTNIENKGQSGIELSMDKELMGKEGFVIMQRDGRGNNRPSLEFPKKDSENGNNIVLTLDINIQRFAEEELADGVKKFNADGGKVIIQSVKTGEVLAMSSYPTFDPNRIQTSDTSGMKNAAITDIFEPGSTFKIITAAASIEENLEDRSSIIATESVNEVKGLKFKDEQGASSMSFQQAIEQSNNMAFSKIALKLGPEKFYKYARDFGIGIYNGIELPGENKGILKRPLDFSGVTLPYMSIGYEVLINSMQLTNAYATIANNGRMMKSYIVKREFSPNGMNVFESRPTMIRQVVSENTAKLLTSLFTGVVERGTGTDAKVEGISIAGKTGTSQRIIKGEYSNNSHNSSFVGFFPAEDPQIIITVIINNPKSGEYYGGKVAAPVFQKITSKLVNFSGASDITGKSFVNVNYTGDMNHGSGNEYSEPIDRKLFIPNLLNIRYEDAVEILKENNLSFETVDTENKKTTGDSKIIDSQFPMPNEIFRDKSEIKIKLVVKERNTVEERMLITPDISNLSLRRAINVLISAGFDADINGSGKIIDQSPKAGTKLLPKSKIIIYCKNN